MLTYSEWNSFISPEEKAEFLNQAMKGLPRFRFFRRSVSIAQMDAIFLNPWGSEEWLRVKALLKPGDRIWPFIINQRTLAMRKGYLVVRRGKPIEVLTTAVS